MAWFWRERSAFGAEVVGGGRHRCRNKPRPNHSRSAEKFRKRTRNDGAKSVTSARYARLRPATTTPSSPLVSALEVFRVTGSVPKRFGVERGGRCRRRCGRRWARKFGTGIACVRVIPMFTGASRKPKPVRKRGSVVAVTHHRRTTGTQRLETKASSGRNVGKFIPRCRAGREMFGSRGSR